MKIYLHPSSTDVDFVLVKIHIHSVLKIQIKSSKHHHKHFIHRIPKRMKISSDVEILFNVSDRRAVIER